jgi:membrane-bound serine protease (ClpP class)
MTGRRLVALLLLVLALAPWPASARTAVVITLNGAVGPGSAAYVVRNITEAPQQDAAVIVLRMDTPGGLDSAMRDIIRAMLASPVPIIGYVAPGGARAASAGTYILYAAGLAAMAPATNLGAAAPVSMFADTPLTGTTPSKDAKDADADKPKTRDAELVKITNDAVAYIRGLATLHGRNVDWAEKAVREAVSLSYDAALDQHVIDLVADDVPDLLAKANGRTVIAGGKKVQLDTTNLQIVEVGPNLRDKLLALVSDPSIVYLLLLAGLFGVAFELSHPGIYAPGAIGAISLLLGAYGLELLPVDYAGLALVFLGVGLMAAEAFAPSFGAFVLGGAASFVIGSLLMFEAPGIHLPLALIAGATLVAVVLFGVVLALLIRARRRPLVTGGAALIGSPGRAIIGWIGTEGEVVVWGERWRARAKAPLHSGQPIRVIGREGLTLLVEPTT